MKNSQSGLWIGEKDLNHDSKFLKEAQEEMQSTSVVEQLGEDGVADKLESSRRDFLKYLGFGIGAATIAASCEAPVKRAIPYVVKPDEIVPGVATYYASSYVKGGDFCSILVKTREGRPIKIEGNDMSGVTHGGTSARAQASVLDLYDINRLKGPSSRNLVDGVSSGLDWAGLDTAVTERLAASSGIRFLTNTIISPTYKKVLNAFTAKYPNAKVVTYDPVSYSALLDATEQSFGDRVIPDYHFDKANVIVSFNADFLGTWVSPIEYAHQYAKNRKITKNKKSMSRHYQVECGMSMTGSNADNRVLVKPSEQSGAIAYLYGQITGGNVNVGSINEKAQKDLQQVAARLLAAKGSSLVICGNNNVGDQVLVHAINNALGNVGSTVTFSHASLQKQGSDTDLANLVQDMKSGNVDTLIINGANPVYDTIYGAEFAEAMAKVNTKIALNYTASETSALCNYIAPVSHTLESWGDAEPKRGMYSLIQPTIKALFNTRQAELSMLTWAGANVSGDQPYMTYLKSAWQGNQFSSQSNFSGFSGFWDNALHNGVVQGGGYSNAGGFSGDIGAVSSLLNKPSNSELEISFFEPITVGNGEHANNPWLQEMPDPVTRTSWGNYLAVPVAFDGVKKFIGYNDLKDGDLVNVTIGDKTMSVPVIQQFGQMPGTVSLAIGYGRKSGGFASAGTGVNVNDCLTAVGGYPNYYNTNVSVSRSTGKEKEFACVQYHHTMGVKDIEKSTGEMINADEATLAPGYGNIMQGFQGSLVKRSIIRNAHVDDLDEAIVKLKEERANHNYLNDQTLYPYDEYLEEKYKEGHHWGMHVDMNACTGCGACTVACMAENNVPVVGKKQVSRHQEMTWLRIDRYYYGDVNNPNTVYQPLMCQHCDNAPCENVCPVNATNHSSEGLNQMAYNRCVGTRYCANNCPYKVRRFNWLDYTTADIFPGNQYSVNGEDVPYGADNLTRMVLNPDVTVRTRGVIEKCSFCVQRIQEGKLTAKVEGRRLRDSDVKTACQTACPTGAIVFGDRNNNSGELMKRYEDGMSFAVLEEVNTRSAVRYSMKINNRDESLDA